MQHLISSAYARLIDKHARLVLCAFVVALGFVGTGVWHALHSEGLKTQANDLQRWLPIQLSPSQMLLGLAVASLAAGLVFCGFRLRDWKQTLMAFVTAYFAQESSLALVWYAGGDVDVVVALMPLLVYWTTMVGAIHLVKSYRNSFRFDGTAGTAHGAAARSFWPCAFCNLAMAVGLISLQLTDLPPLHKFGSYAAASLMLSLVWIYLFLPACLSLWPTPPEGHERPMEVQLPGSFGGKTWRIDRPAPQGAGSHGDAKSEKNDKISRLRSGRSEDHPTSLASKVFLNPLVRWLIGLFRSGENGARSMAVIEARGLTRVFGTGEARVEALKGVDLTVNQGEFVAIMGASGSGKSTLLYLLGGIDVPTEGQVLLEGIDLASLSDDRRTLMRRQRIGFIFQSFNLLPTLTAEENVALPLELDGVSSSEARGRAAEMLELVGVLHRRGHIPSTLSGGEQQRVAIARSLVTKPAMLLADEPTGNLDSANGQLVIRILRKLVDEQKQTIVMVSHDPAVAELADRIVRIRDGRIASDSETSTATARRELVEKH